MVSFQCEGCGDVVKKPKLDKHGTMCKSSFTCIDCSTTFTAPSEWKGHTQCITEAEKYQKGLYKGPKSSLQQQQGGQTNNNANGNSRSYGGRNTPATGTYQSWGRNNSQQGARPAWGKQYTRNAATGANDTPLGTPVRMSPVTSPASPSEPEKKDNSTNKASATSAEKTVAALVESSATKPTETTVGKKDRKNRKRKAVVVEAEAAGGNDEPCEKKPRTEHAVVSPLTPVESAEPAMKKKRNKRSKDKKDAATNGDAQYDVLKEQTDIKDEGNEGEAGAAQEGSNRSEKDKKKEKRNKKKAKQGETEEVPESAAGESAKAEKFIPDAAAMDVAAAEIVTDVKERKERKRKHKRAETEVCDS